MSCDRVLLQQQVGEASVVIRDKLKLWDLDHQLLNTLSPQPLKWRKFCVGYWFIVLYPMSEILEYLCLLFMRWAITTGFVTVELPHIWELTCRLSAGLADLPFGLIRKSKRLRVLWSMDSRLMCIYIVIRFINKEKKGLAKVWTTLSICLHCLVVNESFSGILVAK